MYVLAKGIFYIGLSTPWAAEGFAFFSVRTVNDITHTIISPKFDLLFRSNYFSLKEFSMPLILLCAV